MTSVVYSNFRNTVLDIQPWRAGMITINLTIQLKTQEQEEEEFYSSDLLLSSEKNQGSSAQPKTPFLHWWRKAAHRSGALDPKWKTVALISQMSKPWYWFCLELCRRNLEATSFPRLLSKTNADWRRRTAADVHSRAEKRSFTEMLPTQTRGRKMPPKKTLNKRCGPFLDPSWVDHILNQSCS